MRLSRIFGCIALAAAGCGGGPAETLTCEWLAGPDNCWANTAMMAASCLPPQAENGTVSADNVTCTYASGPVVIFDVPLTFPISSDANWNFTTAAAGGALCLRYEDLEQSGTTLMVRDQTVRIGGSGLGMSITCPDGSNVQTANALMLLSCPTSMIPVPGLAKAWSNSDTSASLSASILTGLPDPVPVFNCRKTF